MNRAVTMVAAFLSRCRFRSVRKRHIYQRHFVSPVHTASYFTIRMERVFAIITAVIDLRLAPTHYKMEGRNKIIVWIDCHEDIGVYRKWNIYTSVFAIVITKHNGAAIVKTAYPDHIPY